MKNKINIFLVFIVSIILMTLLSSCKNNSDTLNIPQKPISNINENKMEFKLDLENGILTAEVNYLKNDFLKDYFLLNRDFTIQKIICDENEINPEQIKKLITYDENYSINLYRLPKFENSLKVNYTGFLSGDTGFSPYVKETISKDFTFLRWETFYYPIFADNFEDTITFLSSPLEAEITVNVPNGYLAPSQLKLIDKIDNSDTTSFIYHGNISDLNCAIADYKKVSLPYGEFYFFNGKNTDNLSNFVISIMDKSHQYMNEHFGEFEISSDMKYIVIPEGFGSFAPEKAIYADESAFKSTFDMGQLIHEFIHLGWNPKAQDFEIQRTRFFDEGFTSYFTARVLGNLLGEEIYISEIKRCKDSFKSKIEKNDFKIVPISEYGKYEYGGLSYNIGPVFFDELCKLVGTENFDYATKTFLEKYKNTNVDFNIMCNEYIELSDNPELETFFNDWLFTDTYYEKYIN